MVIESIASDPRLGELLRRLSRPFRVLHVTGLWGSSAPLLAAASAKASGRLHVFVTAHLEQADEAQDDLDLFLGEATALFPAWEALPGEGAAAGEILAERLKICGALAARNERGEKTAIMSRRRPSLKVRSETPSPYPLPQRGRGIPGCTPKEKGYEENSAALPSSPSGESGAVKRPRSRRRKAGVAVAERPDAGESAGGQVGDLETPAAFKVLVAPIQALMQTVPSREVLERNTLRLAVGEEVFFPGVAAEGPDALLAWAVERGFSRLDLVESPGDAARRGEIVDLFVPGETDPFRVEFFGDRIESIRSFDLSTQRSLRMLGNIAVTALPESSAEDEAGHATMFDYLPGDAVIVLDDPAGIQELGQILEARLGVSARFLSVTEALRRAGEFPQIHLARFGAAATTGEDIFDFPVSSVSRFEGEAAAVVGELCRAAETKEVHVFCDAEGEKQRLLEMIGEQGGTAPGRLQVHSGVMHHGFEWKGTSTVVLPHHELFQRHRQRRRIRRIHAGRPLESWLDLKPGDLIVHVVHGIAIYRGLTRLAKGREGQPEEFLTLEFAEGAVVHVPCSQIELVQKYIGAGARRPQLSTLGGKRWAKMKERVADSVADLAESLLRVQAVRAQAEGTAFPQDTDWQREFEAAFPYEETDDQLTVAGEIREDLTRTRPMDRVVCGDVGYGKTELAMRAAFKVVEYGRQVAVLVPTTVLAEQHFETFRERFAEYPFTIGCLSRFRGTAEQKRIVQDSAKGRLDVVIGTHRLLSKDVRFAHLGLVIIDEEQRFGVEHKERLRAMRETVDVLTLTATPIPRTLHMALMGIRDISALQTPPVDRRAISTSVRPFSRELIRDAILRELNRDGQVFFVHNFVHSIAAMADTVRSIVPEARVVYAHGQMKDDELEAVMHGFARRQAEVLVTTTIIESGIDMPSVNTIFINRADRYGLADLHQLRGRVGRSSARAYCYLLLSPDRPPTSKAARRLKTIEEFSELGAGFRIAMRDLEIRGAGNLLGKEQSGHIAAVGYEMYCRLLEQTVRRLKNEPDPSPPPVQVDLDVSAHVPREYIASDRLRIETYRRVAACQTAADLAVLEKDLADAFGPLPGPVERLMELSEIRILARRFGVQSISLRAPDVIFVVERLAVARVAFEGAAGSVRAVDEKTIHWRPPSNYLEPGTLVAVLKRLLRKNASVEER